MQQRQGLHTKQDLVCSIQHANEWEEIPRGEWWLRLVTSWLATGYEPMVPTDTMTRMDIWISHFLDDGNRDDPRNVRLPAI